MNKILFNLILYPSKTQKNQGFSLVEVTIAILVSSAFLMGTLQAMTITAIQQIKTERKAQANFWIQQDIEAVQSAANAMDLDKYVLENGETEEPEETEERLRLNPGDITGTQVCSRDSNDQDERFGADLVKKLDLLLENDTYPDGTPNTNTKSEPAIDPTAVFSSAPDSTVVQILRNGSDDETDPDFQNRIVHKNYRLVRLITVDPSHRYDLAQITYRVGEPYDPTQPDPGTDADGDTLRDDEPGKQSIIAENSTEVIPAAVAECGF
ncbi:MAG: prepilin-type N-terminal cleavage/methylation domain-containing protein [Crocosphaera sp.]